MAALVVCAAGVSVLGVAGEDAAKGVRYAFEYYDNGQVKTQIKAGSVVPGEASIKAQDIRGECYTEEGKLDVVILADDCEYSKEKQLITSESDVTVLKDDMTLSGTGFKWDGNEQVVEIASKARLAFVRKGTIGSTIRSRSERKVARPGGERAADVDAGKKR